jgi:hypothetical protein
MTTCEFRNPPFRRCFRRVARKKFPIARTRATSRGEGAIARRRDRGTTKRGLISLLVLTNIVSAALFALALIRPGLFREHIDFERLERDKQAAVLRSFEEFVPRDAIETELFVTVLGYDLRKLRDKVDRRVKFIPESIFIRRFLGKEERPSLMVLEVKDETVSKERKFTISFAWRDVAYSDDSARGHSSGQWHTYYVRNGILDLDSRELAIWVE